MKKYSEVYQGWLADPEKFWMDAAEKIDWFKKPTRASSDLNDLGGKSYQSVKRMSILMDGRSKVEFTLKIPTETFFHR